MKPLSELVKEIGEVRPHPQANTNSHFFKGFDAGLAHATVLLQAWLREADKVLDKYEEDRKYLYPSQIRLHLLGRTRAEGKK